MSEENKISEIQEASPIPAPPKKRGRKKKADTEAVSTLDTEKKIESNSTEDVSESKTESDTDVKSVASEADNASADAEPIANEADNTSADAEAIANEADNTSADAEAIANEADNASADTEAIANEADNASADAEAVANEADNAPADAEAIANEADNAPADAEAVANEADNASADAEAIANEADNASADIEAIANEADNAPADAEPIANEADNALAGDEIECQTDNITDGDASTDKGADTAEVQKKEEGAYANIEHFSDTYEIKYLSDEVDSEIKEAVEEAPSIDAEYENLKIFEDTEPKAPREPKKKRVREVSADYKEYNEEKPRHVDARFDFIELFVYTLVVIMLITTFFFKHSEVSGWSMKGTLSDKDHVLISDFLYEPKQYDIVVVHDPAALKEAVVKRIVALGGQTVRLEYRLVKEKSGMTPYYALDVFVDGEKVPDEYCYCDGADYSMASLNANHKVKGVKRYDENTEYYEYVTFEYTVPDGEIYVMGDHRNDSTDSRRFGSVNENKILGRLIIRFFPFDSFGTVD